MVRRPKHQEAHPIRQMDLDPGECPILGPSKNMFWMGPVREAPSWGWKLGRPPSSK